MNEIEDLKFMVGYLRIIRDSQEIIRCDEDYCICNRFDNIIDSIEMLITDLELEKKKK